MNWILDHNLALFWKALEFAMQSAVQGTMLGKAEIKNKFNSGESSCSKCQNEFYIQELFEACPECGNPFCEIIQGKELKVKSLKAE
ncbi:MAG: hydrogenase maturation nickel metallochaperone HypA [Bacteroidales bacterium]